ncbi:MAG: hypothetical protein M0R06_04030 [Sphaerochaeta sp.]|jgi:hypothetical protein|nr:hypothetical protein [Sphaerochaeta sp.]
MKTYITPNMKEPEIVIHPAGKKDPQGNRIPRKAIQFKTNSSGCGQYSTDKPEEIKFLDTHEYILTGQMTVLESKELVGAAPESKTRQGVKATGDEAKKK